MPSPLRLCTYSPGLGWGPLTESLARLPTPFSVAFCALYPRPCFLRSRALRALSSLGAVLEYGSVFVLFPATEALGENVPASWPFILATPTAGSGRVIAGVAGGRSLQLLSQPLGF